MQSHQILPKHKRDTSFEKKKRAVTTTTGSSGLKAQCVQTEKRQKGGCRAGENGAGGTLQFFPPQASFPTHEKKTKSQTHRHTRKHGDIQVSFFFCLFSLPVVAHTRTLTHTHTTVAVAHGQVMLLLLFGGCVANDVKGRERETKWPRVCTSVVRRERCCVSNDRTHDKLTNGDPSAEKRAEYSFALLARSQRHLTADKINRISSRPRDDDLERFYSTLSGVYFPPKKIMTNEKKKSFLFRQKSTTRRTVEGNIVPQQGRRKSLERRGRARVMKSYFFAIIKSSLFS